MHKYTWLAAVMAKVVFTVSLFNHITITVMVTVTS